MDGWIQDGKLYLRVVDYKSGRKKFDLANVRMGLDIQMLLYLFALQKEGKQYFGTGNRAGGGAVSPGAGRNPQHGAERDAGGAGKGAGEDPEALRAAAGGAAGSAGHGA